MRIAPSACLNANLADAESSARLRRFWLKATLRRRFSGLVRRTKWPATQRVHPMPFMLDGTLEGRQIEGCAAQLCVDLCKGLAAPAKMGWLRWRHRRGTIADRDDLSRKSSTARTSGRDRRPAHAAKLAANSGGGRRSGSKIRPVVAYLGGRGRNLYVPSHVQGEPLGRQSTSTRASNPASCPVPSENVHSPRTV